MTIVNEAFRTQKHSTLAFYGISVEAGQIDRVYEWALGWFARAGCVPNYLGTDFTKGKMRSFKSGNQKLQAIGFESIKSFEIESWPWALKEVLDQDNNGACIFNPKDKWWTRLIIDFRSELIAFDSSAFLRIAKEACELTNPRYGFGYCGPFEWDYPRFYALGIGANEFYPTRDKWLNLSPRSGSTWPYIHNLWWFLRDVYPLNFLTESQLNNKVGNIPLQGWIRQRPERGTLAAFTDTVTLWAVAEAHVPEIRKTLCEAGVIFNDMRDLIDKQTKYYCSEEEVAEHLRTGKPLVLHEGTGKPVKIEDILGGIIGDASTEQVDILKVESPGKVRKLTDKEKSQIMSKKSRNKK